MSDLDPTLRGDVNASRKTKPFDQCRGVSGPNFFYPDVVVDYHFDESEPYFTETPIIIIEVLSKATRKKDRTTKLSNYITIPSLREYVMIEQDCVDVEVLSRKDGWFSKHYFLGDDISFESIGLILSVEAIYDRVYNEDRLEFLGAKSE